MEITLSAFERIDSQLSTVLRFPQFEAMTFEQCKAFIKASNILLDHCIDSTSYEYASSFASAEECAAAIVAGGLLGTIEVLDEMESQ